MAAMPSFIPARNAAVAISRKALSTTCTVLIAIMFSLAAGSLHAQAPSPDQSAARQATADKYGITPQEQVGIDRDISRHFGDAPADTGPKAKLSGSLRPGDIRAVMRKVADW